MNYGRRCKEAVALTGLDYQTLRNYTVVTRRFELSCRRDNLPFQYHAEDGSLSDYEQDPGSTWRPQGTGHAMSFGAISATRSACQLRRRL
jgi:hypothetical protein